MNLKKDLRKIFILRTDYWGGKPHDKQIVTEFVKNIQDTYFTLSGRGAGNWSARFYQVLYLGRIPIVVNTDIVLPFEDKINWNDIIILCNSNNDIANNIKRAWISKDIIQMQIKCKEVYDTYLAPEKWCKFIVNDIFLPIKEKTSVLC